MFSVVTHYFGMVKMKSVWASLCPLLVPEFLISESWIIVELLLSPSLSLEYYQLFQVGAPQQLFKMLCMFAALISHEFVYFWFGSRLTEQVPSPTLKVVPLYLSVLAELSPEEFAAGLVI